MLGLTSIHASERGARWRYWVMTDESAGNIAAYWALIICVLLSHLVFEVTDNQKTYGRHCGCWWQSTMMWSDICRCSEDLTSRLSGRLTLMKCQAGPLRKVMIIVERNQCTWLGWRRHARGHQGVRFHLPLYYLVKSVSGLTTNKSSKLCITDPRSWESIESLHIGPVKNTKNMFMSWRHYMKCKAMRDLK